MALENVAVPAFLGLVSLGCLLLGLLVLKSAVGHFQLLRSMFGDDAEPVDVAEAAPGTVAVSGTAQPAEAGTFRAPFTPDEALVAVGDTLERTATKHGTSVSTDQRRVEEEPFLVDDGTGTVRVEPEDGIYQGDRTRIDTEEVDRSALAAWSDRNDVDVDDPHGYRQQVVSPGDEVYVYGEAVAADGDTAAGTDEPDLRIAEGADDNDVVVSTDGQEAVGGSGLVGGLVLLLFGGLLLFFALNAFVIAVAFLFG